MLALLRSDKIDDKEILLEEVYVDVFLWLGAGLGGLSWALEACRNWGRTSWWLKHKVAFIEGLVIFRFFVTPLLSLDLFWWQSDHVAYIGAHPLQGGHCCKRTGHKIIWVIFSHRWSSFSSVTYSSVSSLIIKSSSLSTSTLFMAAIANFSP